ncbi:acyl-CoA thioesterase FadM [Rhodoblastus acidophilus]|uniref:hypothetical protein n=1 Tax=Rhodoblastus acidophilus TaxID=1074 RepID=UPI0022240BE3|nr:hypothetical protein [Rhodoblastus acidophilus]MCW2284007.1 acyl-CoA thioesterase FadM [Rhodoblastus acidophilus]MCW2332703.1 acyl-CoA thioesterase FadM [Rhodoblastus acidophilus]
MDYKQPRPMGVELIIRGRLVAISGRKATIALSLHADDEVCAVGEMVAVEYRPKIKCVGDEETGIAAEAFIRSREEPE